MEVCKVNFASIFRTRRRVLYVYNVLNGIPVLIEQRMELNQSDGGEARRVEGKEERERKKENGKPEKISEKIEKERKRN